MYQLLLKISKGQMGQQTVSYWCFKNERIGSTLIHHSDRGVQCASKEFQALLKANDIRCNMSRKGNCWDNAVAESSPTP